MISRRIWLIAKFLSTFKSEEMNCKLTWRDLIELRLILEISSKLMRISMARLDPKKTLKLSLDKSSNQSDNMIKRVEICKSIRTKNSTCTESPTSCPTLSISSSSK